jgi:hypothetical protein
LSQAWPFYQNKVRTNTTGQYLDRYRLKRGAGYFLPGVWGCPPALKVPKDWGIRELIETISAVFYMRNL